MSYKNQLGYVLENKDFHVCGYVGGKIIIQNRKKDIIKPRKYLLHTSPKGVYFNFKGKRIYVSNSIY